VAGGHSVDSLEAIYGLVAIGLVDPRHVKRNAGALAGDKIILGKALGVGIYAHYDTTHVASNAIESDDVKPY